jgi:hypothetical protein
LKHSYVICGQIKSRLEGLDTEYFQSLQQQDNDREIVVSTWKGEVSATSYRFIDQLVELDDPGPSDYGLNWHRILKATWHGLNAASNEAVVRSRVEVNIVDTDSLSEIIEGVMASGRFIGFPKKMSLYLFSKGMLFCPPDFFQIGKKQHLLNYWDLPVAPNDMAPFHMTNGNAASLSSDQVLGANYAYKNNGGKKNASDRYLFSFKNWAIQRQHMASTFAYFDEDESGVDFGRLGRPARFKKYTATPLVGNNIQSLELNTLAMVEFLGRYYWDLQKRKFINPYTMKNRLTSFLKNKF